VYHRRIQVSCFPADVNLDGAVTPADVSLFTGYYAANDSRADLNQDGIFSPADVALFFESYACNCDP
jgi:hypothetical protein